MNVCTLAFAVAFDPEILVVDEVLAVGDAAFQKMLAECRLKPKMILNNTIR